MLEQRIMSVEDYKIFDMLAHKMKQERGPLGWVRIFLQTKKGLIYDEGQNLVVAQGREFVAQRIFDTYAWSGGSRSDWTDYVLSHFAVGSGGSIVSGGGSTFTLNGPTICDTSLLTATSLGTSGYLTEPGPGPGPTVATAVKPITADSGSVYLESNTYDGPCTYYTKVKSTCIVPSGEPTSLGAGETTKIDEAGLYFVSGTTAKLFAHICFAPKWKEKESTLTIEWYILF